MMLKINDQSVIPTNESKQSDYGTETAVKNIGKPSRTQSMRPILGRTTVGL